jgi:signal transduction histidine kinase
MVLGHRVRPNPGWEDDDVSELNKTLVDLSIRPELRRVLYATRPEVETVLDIQSPSEWTFNTQPGAFRRIVMNLYGNSLKYTKHGFITVSLRVIDEKKPLPSSIDSHTKSEKPSNVRLTLTDTGQGISPVFLRTKVFTAFSQENSKAAGSGLGLSIVKSLVNQLGGDIDIKSILNVGTIVTVTCRE